MNDQAVLDSPMGETFWQNDSLITHKLFELWLIMRFRPVANFAQQSLSLNFELSIEKKTYFGVLFFKLDEFFVFGVSFLDLDFLWGFLIGVAHSLESRLIFCS